MHHPEQEPVTVFLADQAQTDWFLITRAFKQCCDWNVHPVASGEELLDRLQLLEVKRSARPEEWVPSGRSAFRFLVLLELRLPGMSGVETLARLKADAEFRSIPVIVFTTSATDEELGQCYDLGANAVIEKPPSYLELARSVQVMHGFWAECVKVPYFDRGRR